METSLGHPAEDGNISTCKIRATNSSNQTIVMTGGTAKTLATLVNAGEEGIAAAECLHWTYRLAAHIHRLRRLGIEIHGEREVMKRNWRIRYRLESNICIELLPA